MEELSKIRRIAGREIPGAPHEVLLVLDAVSGLNGLSQAREFTKSSGVTGLVLTKMDGTAKGGVILAIVRELKVPVKYVGVGETADDLLDFDAGAFAEAIVDGKTDPHQGDLPALRQMVALAVPDEQVGRQFFRLFGNLIKIHAFPDPGRKGHTL